jgi:hypothetical protein
MKSAATFLALSLLVCGTLSPLSAQAQNSNNVRNKVLQMERNKVSAENAAGLGNSTTGLSKDANFIRDKELQAERNRVSEMNAMRNGTTNNLVRDKELQMQRNAVSEHNLERKEVHNAVVNQERVNNTLNNNEKIHEIKATEKAAVHQDKDRHH